MLGHILDQLEGLDIQEIIFIVGNQGNQIESYVTKTYPQFRSRYIEQKEMRGQSHAVALAQEYVTGEVLIIFSDTIFKADLKQLSSIEADFVMHLKEVSDPSSFGVIVLDSQGYVTRLVEKPKTPVSNLAIVGIYYCKKAQALFSAINYQIAQQISLGNEFFLADALSYMLEGGAKFATRPVEVWEDCGTIPALLQTNRYLLTQKAPPYRSFTTAQIIPPVYIAPDVEIENSVIGPYVSVAEGVKIFNSIIRDSIIHEHSQIENSIMTDSLVGSRVRIKGQTQKLNLGDDSYSI